MKVSAYAVSGKVWLVRTELTADPNVPGTLPIGSVTLTAEEAARLGAQILAAGLKVERYAKVS